MTTSRFGQNSVFWPRQLFIIFLICLVGLILPGSRLLKQGRWSIALADSAPQNLPFTQNWTNTGLITSNDNWSGVPGIEGFLGQDLTTTTGTDPQTIVGTSSVANDLDVIANQTNPNTLTAGGVAEFEITDPTIALQGSGTADAPHIIINLNTTGQANINVAYNLRDIDGSADNAVQPVALQYRVGSSGNFTNVPAGFVADATTGPNLATKVTPVSATLPAAANNQSLVQVRIITTNAAGSDEWVGIDDINITSGGSGGSPTLSINDVAGAEGNSGTTTFTFTVSLSAPAPAGGVTFDIATQDNTATVADNDYVAQSLTGQTIPAGSQTYNFSVTVNGDTKPEPTETFFVNVTNVSGAIVADGQGVGTISNDEFEPIPIHQIQGSGSASPFAGQSVTTTGIVTGIKTGSSGGFYIQMPDASADADPNTSEGIFVFTGSSVPSGAVIGNNVSVTGTISEFRPSADPNAPPLTEFSLPTVDVLSTGNMLPSPVTITAADTSPNSLENLEKYEGMRVRADSLTVIAPTQGSIDEPNATAASNGVFYAVVTGVARPFREPGISVLDPLPTGAPSNIPRFDENPERIRVDSDAQPGTTALNVPAGTVITNIVGTLDYAFRTYTILPEAATPPVVSTLPTASPVPLPTAYELTIASFNMQRFFNTVSNGTGGPMLTPTAYNNRLNKASLAIRNVMRAPDVIGVEEAENLATLQDIANRINNDVVATGDASPNYQAYLVEGNDIGGIDVGFLVKAARINVVSVSQEGKDTPLMNPDTGSPYLDSQGNPQKLNDRPPLVLLATIAKPGGGTLPFTVIVNHLRSLNDVELNDETGKRVRQKRKQQAEFLANLIQARQASDPAEKIISVGDYNAFQVNDGYVDVIGTIKGTPAPPDQVVLASGDLVNPDLTDLVDTLPESQRYSYTFDGNAQVLDHILVNNRALAILNRFAYARNNADFPLVYYADPMRPERLSDHDMPVAYLSLTTPVVPGNVLISEFRLQGPNGINDEFIELYNNTDAAITVGATDGTSGWALAASDGNARFIIPNGTIIPARGHFLGVNNNGYSLSNYPAGYDSSGNIRTATGDAGWTTDIPNNKGIALFTSATNFALTNRIDAVGFSSETNVLYKEGAGLSDLAASSAQHSFTRKIKMSSGAGAGQPIDTNDNAADFSYAETSAPQSGAGQRLGAPGPENLSSPIQRNAQMRATLLDPAQTAAAPANRYRYRCTDADVLAPCDPNTSPLGYLSIRRTYTNNTGQPVTRLRFRIVDISTSPEGTGPSGNNIADLRALSRSGSFTVTRADMVSTVTAEGLTLEQPPSQPQGGGFNSSLTAPTVTLQTPLSATAPDNKIMVEFLLGIVQTGNFRFFVNVEVLPAP